MISWLLCKLFPFTVSFLVFFVMAGLVRQEMYLLAGILAIASGHTLWKLVDLWRELRPLRALRDFLNLSDSQPRGGLQTLVEHTLARYAQQAKASYLYLVELYQDGLTGTGLSTYWKEALSQFSRCEDGRKYRYQMDERKFTKAFRLVACFAPMFDIKLNKGSNWNSYPPVERSDVVPSGESDTSNTS